MEGNKESWDAVIVGGGIMGCATALTLAEDGMRVRLLERHALCTAASGVNAGTLSLQIKRAALVPYALRGYELWKTTSERFGIDIGLHVRGGLTLAFTDREAEILVERMSERRAAGLPAEIIEAARAREIEPGLTERVCLASYCPLDGYANASVTGRAYYAALMKAGVDVAEGAEVNRIERVGGGFLVSDQNRVTRAARVVLSGGAWLERLGAMLGVALPVHYRVNQVSVTERCPPVVRAIVGHATGLLTLKQSDNGTVLVGGGWQGTGDPYAPAPSEVVRENLIGNLRLARFAIPALARTRLVRTWHGYEAHVPDFLPIVGALPRNPNAFVIGCVRGGYTIGPYMGRLLGQLIVGREPEMPLFDPARFSAVASLSAPRAAP